MPGFAILIILGGILTTIAMIVMAMKYSKKYYSPDATHITASDKEILLLIGDQKDGLLNISQLVKHTGMTKSEAKKRITILSIKGIVKTGYTSSMKYYYSLKQPIKPGPYPSLSTDPFLTLGDLMSLFKFFDYRLSIQDICMATNLPVSIIASEMKYFIKEKIVDALHHTSTDGMTSYKFYILKGEYRDDPDKYQEIQKEIDLDLSKLYVRHKSSET